MKYEDTKQYILWKNTQIDNKLLTEIKELSPKETHQLLSVMGVKMQRGGKITEYLGKKDNLVENITKKNWIMRQPKKKTIQTLNKTQYSAQSKYRENHTTEVKTLIHTTQQIQLRKYT